MPCLHSQQRLHAWLQRHSVSLQKLSVRKMSWRVSSPRHSVRLSSRQIRKSAGRPSSSPRKSRLLLSILHSNPVQRPSTSRLPTLKVGTPQRSSAVTPRSMLRRMQGRQSSRHLKDSAPSNISQPKLREIPTTRQPKSSAPLHSTLHSQPDRPPTRRQRLDVTPTISQPKLREIPTTRQPKSSAPLHSTLHSQPDRPPTRRQKVRSQAVSPVTAAAGVSSNRPRRNVTPSSMIRCSLLTNSHRMSRTTMPRRMVLTRRCWQVVL